MHTNQEMAEEKLLDQVISIPVIPKPLSIKKIFRDIWFSPGKVLKEVVDQKYEDHEITLLFFYGLAYNYHLIISSIDSDRSWFMICVLFVVKSVGMAVIGISIYSYVVGWLGRLMGGKLKGGQVTSILTYSLIPSTCAIVFLPFTIKYYDQELSPYSLGSLEHPVLYVINILTMILCAWSAVIFLIGIHVNQGFSLVKTVLSALLPFGVILIAFMAIFFMVFGFSY